MTDDVSTVWPDGMDSEERVRAVAEVLTQPRSARWVSDQADVDYKTARKYLSRLVEDRRLSTVERDRTTLYYANPREQFFREIEELVDEYTKDELTTELNAISDRIESWQETYDIEDPDELRTTLDESLSVEERREREQVVDTWEYNREMRTFIRHAIRLYDDLNRYAAGQTPTRATASTSE